MIWLRVEPSRLQTFKTRANSGSNTIARPSQVGGTPSSFFVGLLGECGDQPLAGGEAAEGPLPGEALIGVAEDAPDVLLDGALPPP
jgi:hypothetical protein